MLINQLIAPGRGQSRRKMYALTEEESVISSSRRARGPGPHLRVFDVFGVETISLTGFSTRSMYFPHV